jgi:uncharacterized protein YndB with AHSA1/START domain
MGPASSIAPRMRRASPAIRDASPLHALISLFVTFVTLTLARAHLVDPYRNRLVSLHHPLCAASFPAERRPARLHTSGSSGFDNGSGSLFGRCWSSIIHVISFNHHKFGHNPAPVPIPGRSCLVSQASNPNAALSTERVLSANPRQVFSAFEQPDRLAQWWGPDGFTNTFEQFEFRPGGRWVFVMHGPSGADYPNENVFREIEPAAKIVIEHVGKPWYKLTVTLTARGGDQTHLAWVQEFESPEFAAKMRPLCEPANEQNLNRLESIIASENS